MTAQVRTWRGSSKRTARKLLLAACSLGLSLLFCEVALQLAARFIPLVAYEVSPPWSRERITDTLLGYRLSPFYPGHDKRGYRNDDALAQYDILALGDSLTYGVGARPTESWPRRLRELLGHSVYDAGVPGYGPCEYRVVLDELLALRPRQVVLALYLGNDVGDAYVSVYAENRCADLATTDSVVLDAMRRADEHATLHSLAAQYRKLADTPSEQQTLIQRSAVYGLGRSLWYQLDSRKTNFLFRDDALDDTFESGCGRTPTKQCVVLDSPEALRTVFRDPRADSLAVDLSDPRIAEGLRVTERVIQEIQHGLEQQQIGLLVVLLRNKPTVLAAVLPQVRPDVWSQLEEYVSREDDVAERLGRWMSENRVSWLDSATSLRTALERGQVPYHQSDDDHPNATGYNVIAGAVREALGAEAAQIRVP